MIGGRLKDPRIGFVTVTRVEVGTDLRNARVFVGVLGSEMDRQKTLTGLRQAHEQRPDDDHGKCDRRSPGPGRLPPDERRRQGDPYSCEHH